MTLAQLPLAVQLPDDETFKSYINDNNQHIISHLEQLIAGKLSINGFYLFGSHGTGKSHILHACCTYASQLSKSSLCLSLSELSALSVELLDGLEKIDIVCLDDIQCIVGNDKWQQAIFDLFNRMIEQDKCLIISGDQNVQQLGLNLPDLESRLSWGVVEQLKPLTDEGKIRAFQGRAKQRGLSVQVDVVKFLLSRLNRDMGHLLYCLDTLDKASIQEQRKITIPFIKEILHIS